MAVIAAQPSKIQGTTITYASATAGGTGDTFRLDTRSRLTLRNASGADITTTLVVPGNNVDGQAEPDIAIVVTAGTSVEVSGFTSRHVDPATGYIKVTHSGVTTYTLALTTS